MTYWQTYYHLVWATRNREPLLVGDVPRVVTGCLYRSATDQRGTVHAVGMTADHIHVAVSIPPAIAVAEFVRRLKGGSSHLVNQVKDVPTGPTFGWQAEYGVLTFGQRALPMVSEYLVNQESHHNAGTTLATFERIAAPP